MIFRPEDYGATPIAGNLPATDCRPAFQAAIDACAAAGGGDVVVGPGSWLLSRAPANTYNRFACLSWHAPNVNFVGSGQLQTKLVIAGDAEFKTLHGISCDPGASGGYIGGFTMDTTGIVNPDPNEQTHAIVIGSSVVTSSNGTNTKPVRDITVSDISFLHYGPAGVRWGDAIRVSGNSEATPAINVKLLNLNFLRVGRSGVLMQRNIQGLLIDGCYFDANQIGGTAIDGEMTPGSGLPTEWPRGLVISNNQIVRTLPGGDNFAITLTSQTNFAITNNVLIGRGISAVRMTDGVIANNSIDATDQLAELSTLAIDNLCRDVVVANNTIRRRGAAGPCIKVQPHSGVFAGDLVIANNALRNETDGPVVFLAGARDTVVHGNKITGGGTPAAMGVYADAGTRSIENLAIGGNVFRGCSYAPVRLVAALATSSLPARGFTGTTIVGNSALASGPGVRADNTAAIPAGGVTSTANNWNQAPTYNP